MFTVIQKSVYNYKKRKPRKRKILNRIKNKIKCSHKGCEGIFKTKKQLVYHHYKMNVECHNDIINLLKLIYSTKTLLLKKSDKIEEISKKYGDLYRETMKKIIIIFFQVKKEIQVIKLKKKKNLIIILIILIIIKKIYFLK